MSQQADDRPPAATTGCDGTSRIGYVLKMYPRFSETFIVNELLALEATGSRLDLFSLRAPVDGRFHDSLADVQAEVTYLPLAPKASDLWSAMAESRPSLPHMAEHLDDLLEANPTDAAQAVRLAVLVKQRGITHLHAHFASVATTVARLAARLAGVPYSFTAHAKDIFHVDVDANDLRRKLHDAASVVTVSDFNLAHLRTTFGPVADRVHRIYNGLDLDRFPFSPKAPRNFADPATVVAVGRLVEKKGFDDLLEAVVLLLDDGRDVRLDIVGTGPMHDALRDLSTGRALVGRVRMLGAQPMSRVRETVSAATVFAAPCIVGADGNRDGLPTVLLEAMALGTPCVATPVTGIPEVVHHERTGLLVPERDPRALAAAIARLLDDEALATRLAVGGRAAVESEFDVHRQAEALRRIFDARLGPAGPSAGPGPVRAHCVGAVPAPVASAVT